MRGACNEARVLNPNLNRFLVYAIELGVTHAVMIRLRAKTSKAMAIPISCALGMLCSYIVHSHLHIGDTCCACNNSCP